MRRERLSVVANEHVGPYTLLRVERGGRVRDFTATLRPGEVVGVTGTIDSGILDLPGLVGAARPSEGRIQLGVYDLDLSRARVIDLLRAEIVMIPQDRHGQGLATDLTVEENIRLGRPEASKDELENVLKQWATLAPSDRSLSPFPVTNASEPTRIAFAHYLNQTGRAFQSLSILGRQSRPLGDRGNVPFNAVFGESLGVQRQWKPAREVLDGVLGIEADNEVALTARARLLSAIGDHRGAIIDAQRLTASYPIDPDYRVLLTQVYLAAGDKRNAERTLWDGYRDLPLSDSLYSGVRRSLMSRRDADGIIELDRAHEEDRFAQLLKELA